MITPSHTKDNYCEANCLSGKRDGPLNVKKAAANGENLNVPMIVVDCAIENDVVMDGINKMQIDLDHNLSME